MSKSECEPQLDQKVRQYYSLLRNDTEPLQTLYEGLKGFYIISDAYDTRNRVFPSHAAPSEIIRTAEGQIIVNIGMWKVVVGTLAENEQLVTFNLADCSGFAFRMQGASSQTEQITRTPDVFLSAHVPIRDAETFDELKEIIKERQYHVLDVLVSAQAVEIPYLQDQINNYFPAAQLHVDPRGYYDYGGLILTSSIGALLREVETDIDPTYTPTQCWVWS